jgi:ABC-type antimicrobial peptide transport system permease subunit
MAEFNEFNNNNQNQDSSRDNNLNNQNPYNKVPEYNFWAEQVPGNSQSYNNQGNNTWQNNTIANDNNLQQKQKKKSGGKVLKFIAKSVCFGVIAGVCFIGLQKIVSIYDPNAITLCIWRIAGWGRL